MKDWQSGEEEIVSSYRNIGFSVGEMSIDETEETLTDPNNRILRQICVEDAKAADKLFEDLMGAGVTMRKLFIKEHSADAEGVI